MKPAWGVVRVAVTIGLLLLVARILDVGQVMARLGDLQTSWVALGLALSLFQVGVQAWRWRYTAAQLGIHLPMRVAVSEYYLGLFLNQALPGGVGGDVSRAWRHARTEVPTGSAVRAVVLERASAQVVMTAVAVLSLLMLPFPFLGGRLRVLALSIGAVAAAGVLVRALGTRSSDTLAGRVWRDTQRAVLSRSALPVQFVSAVLLVGSYIAVYLIAARAIGVDTPTVRLLPLVAPVLMTMLVPVTIAGWGIREGAAALLWTTVGLTAEDGVAISVSYGLIVLVSSLPGLVVLMGTLRSSSRGSDRGRTERPRQDGSDDTVGEAPGPDSSPPPE